ncbi:MAG: SoxR reducing system RseC family protein [Bacteroidales bacterium]|nr:SoxR reducing system RseC family protein [Bacteroidales bacterium]
MQIEKAAYTRLEQRLSRPLMTEREDVIDHISHRAVVTAVDASAAKVSVSIIDAGECDACPAARLCSAANSRDSLTITTQDAASFRPGENVEIRGTEQMHRKAIFLATLFPCIILVAVMAAVFILTGSQGIAAVTGLAAMLLFFLILFLCRNKIAHEFQFQIFHK